MNMKTLKNDKKVFFFDIDGTLAMGKKVPESAQKALQELRKQGHLLFICTGRPYEYASQFFHQYVDGFVTSNGRYIVYQNNVLLDKPLDHKQIQYFMEIMRKHHCGFAFIDHQKGFLENEDSQILEETMKSYGKDYYQTAFTDDEVSGYMFDLYFSYEEQFQAVQEDLQDTVILNKHTPHPSADATIIGVDKGDGIDEVLKYFEIDKEQAYAFGDGANDACMFAHVGHPIAMGNAIDILKEKAEYVTTSIDQNGIYNALLHYGLIVQ